MKKSLLLMICGALLGVSCGNQPSQGASSSAKKFNPQQKTSLMSDSERQEAIARKRSELAVVDFDSLITLPGVKFSILPPAVSENMPLDASDRLCNKLIQVAAQNGISGLCTNPVLAMVTKVDRTGSAMTNDIPQKAIVKCEVTYYCCNMMTNDIYASCSQSLTGVGPDFEMAMLRALDEVDNSKQVKDMFATASARAIEWYNVTNNVSSIAERYIAEERYALALAILNSVPVQATATYDYAVGRGLEVTTMMFEEKATELYVGMLDMIAANDTCYHAEVGAIFKLISPRSAVYAEARKSFDDYVLRVQKFDEDKRKMKQDLEAEKRRIEYETAVDIRDKNYKLSLAELEVRKVTAPIEAKAAIEKLQIDGRTARSSAWSSALASSAASIGHGMRGGMFGENGMFGQGGILGIGSFAEPINRAVDGLISLRNDD